jgi:hypothetical protein
MPNSDATVNAFLYAIVERDLNLKILNGDASPTKNNKHRVI